MASVGSSSASSVGGTSVGGDGDGGESNASAEITGVRGRIDDMVKSLTALRGRVTEENWHDIASALDAADEHLEPMANSIFKDT